MKFKAAVITVSDRAASGEREDASGDALARLLEAMGADSTVRAVVPDERERIAAALIEHCDAGVDLILTTGGTGLAPRDVTPEATLKVIDRQASGFAEAIRAESLRITPRAMLSRAVSGVRGSTLIINLPGSPRAAEESFKVIEPALGHALEVIAGECDECAR